MHKLKKLNYSVVIPTHDRSDLLEKALRSVFSQDTLPIEIFIIDDLKQNKVQKIVKRFSKEFHFEISYLISKSKNGVSHSYNLGASKAKAKYLAFLDDDDFWGRNYISSINDLVSKKDIDLVLTRLTEFDDQTKITKPGKCPPQKYNVKDFYIRNPGVLRSNLFLKRSCFELAKGYDEKIFGSSDKDLFMRLKSLNKTHYIIDMPNLVYWRTNHKSQASSNYRRMLRNVINFYKKYFFLMPVNFHLKMINKILRLVFISNFKKN